MKIKIGDRVKIIECDRGDYYGHNGQVGIIVNIFADQLDYEVKLENGDTCYATEVQLLPKKTVKKEKKECKQSISGSHVLRLWNVEDGCWLQGYSEPYQAFPYQSIRIIQTVKKCVACGKFSE